MKKKTFIKINVINVRIIILYRWRVANASIRLPIARLKNMQQFTTLLTRLSALNAMILIILRNWMRGMYPAKRAVLTIARNIIMMTIFFVKSA